MAIVYVLSKDGKPLMPTDRCGHVRFLIKTGRAVVERRLPFTIKLQYDVVGNTQPLWLGIDPGRTNIGVAVVNESGDSLFEAELQTRNKDIPKLMKERSEHRRKHRYYGRRAKKRRRAVANGTTTANLKVERRFPGYHDGIQICKDCNGKTPKFNHRTRKEGWLTPTANHLLLTHVNLVKKLSGFLPISDVVLELNKFAFMQLDDPSVKKYDFQRGQLFGHESVYDAVDVQQDGHCLLCKNPIEHYHHIVPKSKGGSDTLPNLAGLCEKHHAKAHTDQKVFDRIVAKKAGLNKKYGALSVLNQIIPKLIETIATMFRTHFYVTDGKSTHDYREAFGIHKEHHLDAYCIAMSVLGCVGSYDSGRVYLIKQFRRHDRQACHKEMLDRKYYLDGVLVAKNRHKAMEQRSYDSLEEFRAVHTEAETSRLVAKPHFPQLKNLNRIMPGAVFAHDKKLYVLQRYDGRHNGIPDYCVDTDGGKHPYKRCEFVSHNVGFAVVQ